jgi:hypothetical protein
VPWTKVDQSDFYALSAIDAELAEEVKRIATEEGKQFREVLRSAVNQMKFRRKTGLKKFWENMSAEERAEHTKKASQKRWSANSAEKPENKGGA